MLQLEPGERRYDERTTVTRQRSERPTLAEVANAAGVSRATVSKVLNGRHDVSSETRTHVEQLLAEHSYVRRSAARDGARAAPTTGTAIDLVVDTLVSPYTLEVIRGVSEAAEEAGMEVVLSRGASNGDGGRWAERVVGAGRQGREREPAHVSPPWWTPRVRRDPIAVGRVAPVSPMSRRTFVVRTFPKLYGRYSETSSEKFDKYSNGAFELVE